SVTAQDESAKKTNQFIKASRITIMINDGEDQLEFIFDGDHRTVKVNGEVVPAERIVESDTHLIIKGKSGETLFKLDRNAPGAAILGIEGKGAVYGVQWDDQLTLNQRGDQGDLYTFTTAT